MIVTLQWKATSTDTAAAMKRWKKTLQNENKQRQVDMLALQRDSNELQTGYIENKDPDAKFDSKTYEKLISLIRRHGQCILANNEKTKCKIPITTTTEFQLVTLYPLINYTITGDDKLPPLVVMWAPNLASSEIQWHQHVGKFTCSAIVPLDASLANVTSTKEVPIYSPGEKWSWFLGMSDSYVHVLYGRMLMVIDADGTRITSQNLPETVEIATDMYVSPSGFTYILYNGPNGAYVYKLDSRGSVILFQNFHDSGTSPFFVPLHPDSTRPLTMVSSIVLTPEGHIVLSCSNDPHLFKFDAHGKLLASHVKEGSLSGWLGAVDKRFVNAHCYLDKAIVEVLSPTGELKENFAVPGVFVGVAATQRSLFLLSNENLMQVPLGGTSKGKPTGTWNREEGDTLHCVAAAGNRVAVLSTANDGGTAIVTMLELGSGNTVQSLE